MKAVEFNHSTETGSMADVFGIPKDRLEELYRQSMRSIWELHDSSRNDFSASEVIEAFVKHALNEQELVVQSIAAANFCQEEGYFEEA